MNDIKAGRFLLDEYDFVIGPDLTLETFKTMALVISAHSESDGYSSFSFEGSIAGTSMEFFISFHSGKIRLVGFFPKLGENKEDWSEVPSENQKEFLDLWLLEHAGTSPSEFDWGTIAVERDIKNSEYGIIIVYKAEPQALAEATKDPLQ